MQTSLDTREPDEAAMTAEMIDIILRRKMARNYDAGDTRRAQAVFDGVVMGAIDMRSQIIFVLDRVFSVSALPDASFLISQSAQ